MQTSEYGSHTPTISPCSSQSVLTPVQVTSKDCASTPKSRPSKFDNFAIPTVWSEYTTKCLTEKQATPKVRKEMVHTLSIMMMAQSGGSPTPLQCEKVANAIVAQYPFLADPYGKSQAVSAYHIAGNIGGKNIWQIAPCSCLDINLANLLIFTILE